MFVSNVGLLYMRLTEYEDRIQADKNKKQDSYDQNMGTICFHSAVCLKRLRMNEYE
jgi:hypothetical protein